jgi:hypothetical protein
MNYSTDDEDQLRRTMRELVAQAPPPTPTTGGVIADARARRHRHTVGVTALGLVAATAIAVPLLARHQTGAQSTTAATATSSVTSAESTRSTTTTPPSTGAADTPATGTGTGPPGVEAGPASPSIGVPYPYDLYVHCGIKYTRFGGRWWHAAPERPGPQPAMAYGGNPYTRGTMTLVSVDEARFERTGPDVTVTFQTVASVPSNPCD